jgi:hypothetical protein
MTTQTPHRLRRFGRAFVANPVWQAIGAIAGVGALITTLLLSTGEEAPPPQASTPRVGIDAIGNPMPRCVTVRGSAPADGRDRWLAVRAAGDDSEYYFAQTRRDAEQSRWHTGVTVGDGTAGVVFEFFLFEVDESFSDFLASVEGAAADGGPGYFYARTPPPGVDLGRPGRTAVSGTDTTPCGSG